MVVMAVIKMGRRRRAPALIRASDLDIPSFRRLVTRLNHDDSVVDHDTHEDDEANDTHRIKICASRYRTQ